MSPESFESGDVFWAPDPYTSGGDPRPWLVLAADGLPYSGEEYVCAGLTLSALPDSVEVTDGDWVVGSDPDRTSYCSPWVVATVKHDAVAGAQGALTDEFTRRVVDLSITRLAADVTIDF